MWSPVIVRSIGNDGIQFVDRGLGIEIFDHRGRALDVGEEHRHVFALALERAAAL
jgi:hypothetical protein